MRKFSITSLPRLSSKKSIKQLSALSLNSTQTVDAAFKPTSDNDAAAKSKKTVSFNEGENEWYYAEDANGDAIELSPKDIRRLFYSGAEVQAFREEAMYAASKFALKDKIPTAVAKTLTRAYDSKISTQQSSRLLKELYIPAHMIGLESWIVRKKSVDDRKEAVVDAVMEAQAASFSDESVRWEKMRAASAAHSKYSAAFCAQLASKAWSQKG